MEQQTQQPQQNKTNIQKGRPLYIALGLVIGFLVIFGIFVLIQSKSPRPSVITKDACIITGCSSQICSDQEVITTCEALPELVCYKNAVCERQSNGACGWTQTSELTQCLQAKSAKQTLIDTSDWQTYRNDEFGFEVRYPKNFFSERTPSPDVREELRNNQFGAIVVSFADGIWEFQKVGNPAFHVIVIKTNLSPQEWLEKYHKPVPSEQHGNISEPLVGYRNVQETTINGVPTLQFDQLFTNGSMSSNVIQKKPDTLYQIAAKSNSLGTFPPELYNQILSTFRFVGDTDSSGVPSGYSSEIIQVKFVSGTDVDPPESTLPLNLQSSVVTIRRLFTLSEEELDRIGGAQLKLWFEIQLEAGVNPIQFIEELRSLNNVENAQFAPLLAPLR